MRDLSELGTLMIMQITQIGGAMMILFALAAIVYMPPFMPDDLDDPKIQLGATAILFCLIIGMTQLSGGATGLGLRGV